MKWKVTADVNFIVSTRMKLDFYYVENIEGKGENTGNQ